MASLEQMRKRNRLTDSGGDGPAKVFSHGFGCDQAGWAGIMAPAVTANPERPELAPELAYRFCRLDPVVERDFARVTFLSDLRDELPRIRAPALIVQLRRHAIAPASGGQGMHQRMPGSSLRQLEIGGHCPHLSHPVETSAVIRDYAAQC